MNPARPRARMVVAWMIGNLAAALLPPVYLSLGTAAPVLPGVPCSIVYFPALGLSIVLCLLAAYRDDEKRGYFATCRLPGRTGDEPPAPP